MPAFWGVVRSLPKREAFAAERLRMDGGFEVFLPQIQTKRTSQPLFPSYLFARIVEQWRSINYTLGVLCLVRVGDCPARLPRPRGRQPQGDDRRARLHQAAGSPGRARPPPDCDRLEGSHRERALWRDVGIIRRHEHQGPREDLAQSSWQSEAGFDLLQPGHSGALKRDRSWTGRSFSHCTRGPQRPSPN